MSDLVHDQNENQDDPLMEREGIDLLHLRFVEDQILCSFNPDVFSEGPGTWGVVLADVIQNLCSNLTNDPVEREKILQEIRSNFLEALDAAAESSHE